MEGFVVFQKMIEETQVLLDELPGVTPVHGPFYKVLDIHFLRIKVPFYK